ncbi:MAG: hypothetical protein PHV18_14910 [Lachnospiraceae bacterium]|nr:hypothetical protein [Lachnospiraceae bacterium]
MQRISFDAGEQRHIKILIHSIKNDPFVIRNAKWELVCAGTVESYGDCEIEEHVIDAFIAPQSRSMYRLRIQYEIADEVLVEQMEVVVV